MLLSSIRSLNRKWFCPLEKFEVFQQYMPKADIRRSAIDELKDAWSSVNNCK